jgi:hypothetical protein
MKKIATAIIIASAIELAKSDRRKAMTQKCDLCAGACRGHSLGDDESWKPEIGSLSYARDSHDD